MSMVIYDTKMIDLINEYSTEEIVHMCKCHQRRTAVKRRMYQKNKAKIAATYRSKNKRTGNYKRTCTANVKFGLPEKMWRSLTHNRRCAMNAILRKNSCIKALEYCHRHIANLSSKRWILITVAMAYRDSSVAEQVKYRLIAKAAFWELLKVELDRIDKIPQHIIYNHLLRPLADGSATLLDYDTIGYYQEVISNSTN